MEITKVDIEAIIPYIEAWPKGCPDMVGPSGERCAPAVIAEIHNVPIDTASIALMEWYGREKLGEPISAGLMSDAMDNPQATAKWLRDWLASH